MHTLNLVIRISPRARVLEEVSALAPHPVAIAPSTGNEEILIARRNTERQAAARMKTEDLPLRPLATLLKHSTNEPLPVLSLTADWPVFTCRIS